MTSYGQTVTQPGQPLTLTETKKLLRESLDREKVLVGQRDAALAHIKSLDAQIVAANAVNTVDALLIKNLEAQKAELLTEVGGIRQALADQREATASLRTALERAEQEVTRQKQKVKAANRRTLWGIVGGIATGVVVVLLIQK